MATNIQGNWIIEVVSSNRSIFQRFIINGATQGNGVYSSNITNTNLAPVTVRGSNWNITIQAQQSINSWPESAIRLTTPTLVNGRLTFFIESDDYFRDGNYSDLVLKLVDADYIPTPPSPPPPPPVTPPVVVPPVVVPPVVTPPVVVPPIVTPPVVIVPGKVFTKLTTDDKIPTQVQKVQYGIWLDATGSTIGNMITFFTCSTETSESYRRTVYQTFCDSHCDPERHFSIAYGNADGSGSRDLGGYDWMSPTKAVYGQYKSLCLSPTERRFKLGSKVVNHFYAIDVNRSRFGDRLDEGNLEVNLHSLSGSQFLLGNGNRNAHTGSNVKLGTAGSVLRLVDDSRLNLEDLSRGAYSGFYQTISQSKANMVSYGGEVYYMVSGSLEEGVYNKEQPHVYGLLYPRLGTILLDADLLDLSSSFLTVTGSDVSGDNAMKLFTSLSGSALYTDASGDRLGFQARKVKYEYIEQYFIRVKNGDYNFTNNPSYQTGSEGDISLDFYNNPKVYITQVGLYNDNRELLAVAKLSKPILKTYVDEALIQIDLKYE